MNKVRSRLWAWYHHHLPDHPLRHSQYIFIDSISPDIKLPLFSFWEEANLPSIGAIPHKVSTNPEESSDIKEKADTNGDKLLQKGMCIKHYT